jgi:hypothetical protein
MEDILSGWKEIANYLRVSEKSAMRYSKNRDLPIKKDKAGHPIITKQAADEWKAGEQRA